MRIIITTIALVLFLKTNVLAQADLRVPADVPDLATALVLVPDGGTVELAPGTWTTSTLNISGKSVTIRGYGGAEATTIVPEIGEGAIAFAGSGVEVLTLDGIRFADAYAPASPITVSDARLVCIRCHFEANVCLGKGGAISVFALSHDAEVVMQSCRVFGNTAAVAGGALNLEALSPSLSVGATIASTLLAANVCDSGSVIYGDNEGILQLAMTNVTIAGNVGGGATGIFHFVSGQNRPVAISGVNSIIHQNQPSTLVVTDGSAPGSSLVTNMTISDVEGGFPGLANIDSDPQFVDAPGGDFRLAATSPCIDIGGIATTLIAVDATGEGRLHGIGTDLGAYEFRPFDSLNGSGEGLGLSANVYYPVGGAYPEIGEGDLVHIFATPTASLVGMAPIAIAGQILGRDAEIVSPAGFPEVRLDFGAALAPVLLVDPFDPEAGGALIGSTLQWGRVVPVGMSGLDFVVQAFSLVPAAANGAFVASNALRFPIQ